MNLLTCLFLITYNELRQREIHRESTKILPSVLFLAKSIVQLHIILDCSLPKLRSSTTVLSIYKVYRTGKNIFMFILPLFANSRVDLFLSIIKYDSKAISPIQLKKKKYCLFLHVKAVLCNYFLQSHFLYD